MGAKLRFRPAGDALENGQPLGVKLRKLNVHAVLVPEGSMDSVQLEPHPVQDVAQLWNCRVLTTEPLRGIGKQDLDREHV